MARPRKVKRVNESVKDNAADNVPHMNDLQDDTSLGIKEVVNAIPKVELIEVVAIKTGQYAGDYKNLKKRGDRFTIKKEELEFIDHWVEVL